MKVLSETELAIPRSRRLRKKLRTAEFQELGFEITAKVAVSADSEQVLLRWIEFVEQQGWEFGGGITGHDFGGFLCRAGRGTLAENDRQVAMQWLQNHPSFSDVLVAKLRDAWHGWEE